MDLRLATSDLTPAASVAIAGSKSETNRLLLLQALFPQIGIANASDADDSRVMHLGLQTRSGTVNIGHAGTAMRFLTAFYAATPGTNVLLTGSDRMKERPIAILVDALRGLGADITYAGNDGFPPLRICGKKLKGGRISVDGGTSSQFLSALLLVAPTFENGLTLALQGTLTSRPYLEMTLSLLREAGFDASWTGDTISIGSTKAVAAKTIVVESDWSSASYYFSLVALSPVGVTLTLSTFRPGSFQGDRKLVDIYRPLGVDTTFDAGNITLRKVGPALPKIAFDLNDTPDIAQTVAVTCLGLGIPCELTGLHTLRIKETDRLQALKAELEKFGAVVSVTENALSLNPAQQRPAGVSVATYHDHRMAMAFAPLALLTGLTIQDAGVVSKSYPDFWEDLREVGINIENI